MKRIVTLVTMLLLTVFSGVMLNAALPALGDGEAKLVIHFHKWDDNYENIGAHLWKGKALVPVGENFELKEGGIQATGQDDFGLYFEVHYTAGANAEDVGFIPVGALQVKDDGTIVQNWDAKLSKADVLISVKGNAAGSVTHVYVFEGTKGKDADAEKGEVSYLVADSTMVNLLLVFFDPSGEYHENLGVHSWSWAEGYNASGWNMPLSIFKTVGQMGAADVKAGILSQEAESVGSAGLLVYHGDGDGSKYTGNIDKANTPNVGIYAEGVENGLVAPVYILAAGGGNTSNANVYYGENLAEFGVEALTFRFELGKVENGSGTFAMTKNVVYTLFNQAITTNFLKITDEEKAVKKENFKKSFKVVEYVNGEATANEIKVAEINFNEYADDAKEFILTLESDLDHTKEYKIHFNEYIDPAAQPTLRTIRFEVTAPAGTPNIYVVGSLNGWTPGRSNWKLTKGENNVWSLEIEAMLVDKTFEYKYVYAPDWPYEEDFTGNRVLTVTGKTIVVEDEVVWKTAPVEGAEYPDEESALELAEDKVIVPKEAEESLLMDTEAPEIMFLTEFAKTTTEGYGVIEILRYSKWDPTKFPVYRANDNRDGDIRHRVYVPGDQPNRFLDTNELGDYKILLRVVDDWGHVTEKIFVFRVVEQLGK